MNGAERVHLPSHGTQQLHFGERGKESIVANSGPGGPSGSWWSRLRLSRSDQILAALIGGVCVILAAVLPIVFTRSSGSNSQPTPLPSQEVSTGPYFETAAPLPNGVYQAWRAVPGAAKIQTRWQTSINGPWTPWTDFPYPPTTAGVRTLESGPYHGLTYLRVFTYGDGNWAIQNLSTDPKGGWNSYYQIQRTPEASPR